MNQLYGEAKGGLRDIVLSFDDGPMPKTTNLLLDTLEKYDIKAIFFVVGERMESQKGRATIKRAHEQGHMIGNHSYSHPNMSKIAHDRVEYEIRKTHDLIVELTGNCKYFRPPYGSMDNRVDQVVKNMGYSTVLWTVDPQDWRSERKKKGIWVDFAIDQIKRREDSIVLMHDIHRSTVDNVENLIKRVKNLKRIRFKLF